MDYTGTLQKVSVLGAAGKMGSGILLLTAMEMTDLWLQDKSKKLELYAMDLSPDGLRGLMGYLQAQVTRAAEKKTVLLRQLYEDRADLVENGDIIDQYVKDVMNKVFLTTHLEDTYGSTLVFEAIKEDPVIKVKVLSQIDQASQGAPWFFTNTSSIPISQLDQEANLAGRIVGFHFYNPPAVQKLVELIPGSKTLPELIEFANQYAKKLRKVVVPSHDFAGFIGNGHFMRDALYGIQEAERLATQMPLPQAIWTINRVSQDFLIRPMGIFQLIDYVGVDVVKYIMEVMNPHLPDEELSSELLNKMLDLEVRGGQFADGSQKPGFLDYERGRPVKIYDPDKQDYCSVDEFSQQVNDYLGDLPMPVVWKSVNFSPDKQAQLDQFFDQLADMDTEGSKLAMAYGATSKRIGELLVESGVAHSAEDVNKVLMTGFYHAYGPINNYFK